MEAWTDRDLSGAVLHWLVTIQWAGLTLRLSELEVEVESDEEGTLCFSASLLDPLTIERSVSSVGAEAAPVSVPLRALWPVSAAQLVARGYDLSLATAEIAHWAEGSTWEQRRVVLLGRVIDPEWGSDAEPVSCSIEDGFLLDGALVPAPDEVLTVDAYPGVVERAIGEAYPVPIGEPGTIGDSWVPATPGYMVVQTLGAEKLLVAAGKVSATSVLVYTPQIGTSAVFGVAQEADGLGRTVSVVDISGAGVAFRSPDNDFWIAWGAGAGASSGGVQSGRRAAGDVLTWWLERSGVPWDRGRWAAASAALDRFLIDSVVEEPVRPQEWIVANLLPILPLSIVSGPSGLRPIVWQFDARDVDAVFDFDVDALPSVHRIGPMSSSTTHLANSFDLRYGLNRETNVMTGRLLLGGSRTSGDSGATESAICRASQSRYGVLSQQQESHVVYDPTTAGHILRWWSLDRCFPRRTVRYAIPRDLLWLDIGSVVLLRDEELHLDGRLAFVQELPLDGPESGSIVLRVLEDPARDPRVA